MVWAHAWPNGNGVKNLRRLLRGAGRRGEGEEGEEEKGEEERTGGKKKIQIRLRGKTNFNTWSDTPVCAPAAGQPALHRILFTRACTGKNRASLGHAAYV